MGCSTTFFRYFLPLILSTSLSFSYNLFSHTWEVVWEDLCQLPYSNDKFFGKLNITKNLALDNVMNISQPEKFRSVMNETLRNLTQVAAYDSNNSYATGEVGYMDKTIHALVQCTRGLSTFDCKNVLKVPHKRF